MPPEDQFERITLQRLRALEKRYARLVWIVALATAVFVWREIAYHPEVRSDRFVLVDDAGRERGWWHMRNGNPVLVLRRRSGPACGVLTARASCSVRWSWTTPCV